MSQYFEILGHKFGKFGSVIQIYVSIFGILGHKFGSVIPYYAIHILLSAFSCIFLGLSGVLILKHSPAILFMNYHKELLSLCSSRFIGICSL
jgi:hypothetical protein